MSPTRRVSAPAGRVCKANASIKPNSLITPTKSARKHITYGRGVSAKKTTLTQIWGWEKIIDDELSRAEEERDSVQGKIRFRDKEEILPDFNRSDDSISQGNDASVKKGKHSKRNIISDLDKDIDRPESQLAKPQKTRNRRRKTAGDKPSTEFQIQPRHQTEGPSRSLLASNAEPAHDYHTVSQDENLSQNGHNSSQKRQSLQLQSCDDIQSGFSETPGSTSPLYIKRKLDLATIPQTPKSGSINSLEVPSSQSPATPLSIINRASAKFPISHKEVAETSISSLKFPGRNVPSLLKSSRMENMDPHEPGIYPVLEIDDSFDPVVDFTIFNSFDSTPRKGSSNVKQFNISPCENHERLLSSPLLMKEHEHNSFQKLKPCLKVEILDSEAESDEEPTAQNQTDLNEGNIFSGTNLIQKDAQDEILEEINSVSQDFLDLKQNERSELENANIKVIESYYQDTLGPETQFELTKVADFQTAIEDISDNQKMSEKEIPTVTFDPGSLLWTNHEENIVPYKDNKYFNTQRLSTQYLAGMAPRTGQSDVFISIDPQRVTEILHKVRDHETRRYKLPPSVCRAWLYERDPISAVKYMAEISPAKYPGDIIDETGVGNQAFNARKDNSSWTAYEILQLYELANPLTLEELKAKEWLKTTPRPMKWVKIPPAVVDELVANIKSPIILNSRYSLSISGSIEVDQGGGSKASNLSKECVVSETSEFSILCPSINNDGPEVKQQVSQFLFEPRSISPFSQATTIDLTQIQTPREQSVEIVCETPPHIDLASVLPRYSSPQSGRFSSNPDRDIQAPFSLGSSQLLSKSLLEPDSLLNDIVLIPPPILPSSEDNIYD